MPLFLFEPTFINRESNIAAVMSGLSSWKADHQLRTPNLAKARRQMEGNGIPGYIRKNEPCIMALFLNNDVGGNRHGNRKFLEICLQVRRHIFITLRTSQGLT